MFSFHFSISEKARNFKLFANFVVVFLRSHEHFPKNRHLLHYLCTYYIYLCKNLSILFCRWLFREMSCIIVQFLVYFTVIWIMSASGGSNQDMDAFNCHVCGAGNAKKCAGCHSIAYCTKECQVKHWKAGHKILCRQLQAKRYLVFTLLSSLFVLSYLSTPGA